ncbi:MAG: outer membrane protein assembly factor BamD [Candidatus Dependentiae bacterium]|nr:outer membrane protein assembly factor BamD [Candidatus Dependentiae bacterium]
MNNKKYLLYLVIMGIFCTFCNSVTATSTATQPTSQESTPTKNTTLPKKENSNKAKKNSSSAVASNSQKNSTKCPHEDTPIALLNPTELEEVLTCAQTKKAELDNQVEKLEQLIEKAEKIEKKQKAGLFGFFKSDRCPYPTTPLKKLNADQLEEVYAYTQTHKMDNAFIIDLLERLIATSNNHAGVKQYKLQLADTHYLVHHIEQAAACYEDFAVLYPGSNESEYVLYKAIVCMFELSLDADRDQSNTKKTIVLIQEFLKRAKKADLIQESRAMLQKCYDRLYDHEVYVFNFYRKKKNFTAAQLRIDFIKKTFVDMVIDLDKKVADLQVQLELAKHPVKRSKKLTIKRYLA